MPYFATYLPIFCLFRHSTVVVNPVQQSHAVDDKERPTLFTTRA